MRPPLIALAGLVLSSMLTGCGGSATIPQPPSQATSLPPGTAPEMLKSAKAAGAGGMAPAKPSNQF